MTVSDRASGAGVLLSRGRQSTPAKRQAALSIGAVHYHLALFSTTTLVVAHFHLSEVANAE